MTPDLLVIGHVTKDIQPDGAIRQGGAVTFAALAARRWGLTVAAVTSAEADAVDTLALPEVEVCCKPSRHTTVFRNCYLDGARRQYLLAQGARLGPRDVPGHWLQTPLVLLAPVAQEIAPSLVRSFPCSLVALCLQGILREWNGEGLVHPKRGRFAEYLHGPRIVLASRDDIGDNEELLAELSSLDAVTVITNGPRGSRVRDGRSVHQVPAFPAIEVDPTGAGDVFAATFLAAYSREPDAVKAARLAGCAASLFIEHDYADGLPSYGEVCDRLPARGIDV